MGIFLLQCIALCGVILYLREASIELMELFQFVLGRTGTVPLAFLQAFCVLVVIVAFFLIFINLYAKLMLTFLLLVRGLEGIFSYILSFVFYNAAVTYGLFVALLCLVAGFVFSKQILSQGKIDGRKGVQCSVLPQTHSRKKQKILKTIAYASMAFLWYKSCLGLIAVLASFEDIHFVSRRIALSLVVATLLVFCFRNKYTKVAVTVLLLLSVLNNVFGFVVSFMHHGPLLQSYALSGLASIAGAVALLLFKLPTQPPFIAVTDEQTAPQS